MSPRPKRFRKISNPPMIAGMKPYGKTLNEEKLEYLFLNYDEYESIRLCDHEGLSHEMASVEMAVSRPTLTRIYSSARQKIAGALVTGKQLIIEGGKVYYDSDWFNCSDCGAHFNHPNKEKRVSECPLCHSHNISSFTDAPSK